MAICTAAMCYQRLVVLTEVMVLHMQAVYAAGGEEIYFHCRV